MNQRVKTLAAEIRKLSAEDQGELMVQLGWLTDDAADGTPEEIEAAWMEEVDRRIAARERGETQSVSAEEVFAKLDERRRAKWA